MNIDIKLHKNDLPDDLNLGNVLAIDGEFMGLAIAIQRVAHKGLIKPTIHPAAADHAVKALGINSHFSP